MEDKAISITTLSIAAMFLVVGYLSNATVEGRAIQGVENSNFQGVIGIILLLMLVISIFFIIGNIKIMLTKNFHKKT